MAAKSPSSAWLTTQITLLVFVAFYASFLSKPIHAAPTLAVDGVELAAAQRLDRYRFRYEYRLIVSNAGSAAFNVKAELENSPPNIDVSITSLNIGDVEAGQTVTSEQTIFLIQDRRSPFTEDQLQWRFEFDDPAAVPILEIVDYQVLASRRLSRTAFEYTYRASILNRGVPIQSATATLNPFTKNATIVDGSLGFGSVAGQTQQVASDTFVISHDRGERLTLDDFHWSIEFTLPGAIPPDAAVALTQVLSQTGHPLGDALSETLNSQTSTTSTTSDPETGLINLTDVAGSYRWKFSKPGYLPVWREAEVPTGRVTEVIAPWLSFRDDREFIVTVLNGGSVGDDTAQIHLQIPAGAVQQNTIAQLTQLNGQALPGLLPLGWSPLISFWFEIDQPLLVAAKGQFVLAQALQASDIVLLARWDESTLRWLAQRNVEGTSNTDYTLDIEQAGAYALIVADSLPRAPPPPVIGEEIVGVDAAVLPPDASATGRVEPPVSPASLIPAEVTARALIDITANTPVTSGVVLRGELDEHYLFRDLSELSLPRISNQIVAYQRPGDLDPRTLSAEFFLQPRKLFSAADLDTATLTAEILTPEVFAGFVIGPNGGNLANSEVSISAPPGAFTTNTAIELRALDVTQFLQLAPSFELLSAFELLFTGVVPGQELLATFGPQAPNGNFVLARVVSRLGITGLQPVARYASDDNGVMSFLESLLDPRLAGINVAGQYVLLKSAEPLSVVSGRAFDAGGNASDGLLVSIDNSPWVTVTNDAGAYTLLAPLGNATVSVTDLATGDLGTLVVEVDVNGAAVEVTAEDTGPRIVATSPDDGESGVDTVTPVVVDFSEPIAADSFNASSLALTNASAEQIIASVSLNQAGTRATLLPQEPLANQQTFTLVVSSELADENGNLLDGQRVFSFATESPATREAGAQLISYEPGSMTEECADVPGYVPGVIGISCVMGTQGAADAEVPVIIINEASGETATVLSNTDGSFKSFVNAEVDDFITATFINANGTSISLPLSQQRFDDGGVALFPSGGILEASNEEAGKVQILVEPKAVPNKTKFNFDPLSLNQLLALVNGTLPEDAQLLSGLRLETEGDELLEPADIAVEVDPATLQLDAGEAPEDRTFALVTPIEVDGVTVYQIIDKAEYIDGQVMTASPPFDGIAGALGGGLVLAMAMMPVHALSDVVVSGRVVAAPPDLIDQGITEQQILAAQVGNVPLARIAGAVVSLSPCCDFNRGLRAGAFVAVTNSIGAYAILVPANSVSGSQFVARALSLRFPGKPARRVVSTPTVFTGPPLVSANLVFALGGSAASDTRPPQLTISAPAALLPVGEPVEVFLNILDDSSLPSVTEVSLQSADSVELLTGDPLEPADFNLVVGSPVTQSASSIRLPIEFNAAVSALAKIKVDMVDGNGNQREQVITFRFATSPPPPGDDDLPASDPADLTGPHVVSILPARNTVTLAEKLVLKFNEPISRSVLDSSSILELLPVTGDVPVETTFELSNDQTELTAWLSGIRPAEKYSITVNAGNITDLAGNAMENAFLSEFSTPAGPNQTLEEGEDVVGAAVHAGYSYSVDRANGAHLLIHRAGDVENVNVIGSLGLPDRPRSMTFIERYDFKRRLENNVESKPLVVVGGGNLGLDNAGQWLWVIDVSDPTNPQRIASEIVFPGPTTAIGSMQFSAPHLAMQSFSAEGGFLQLVNLQAFILGANIDRSQFADEYDGGVDANGDGDFVDAEDTLPRPVLKTLFGLEVVVPIGGSRSVNDFDTAFGTGFVVATMPAQFGKPSRLQVINFGGTFIGDGSDNVGAYEISGGDNAFRVVLDLNVIVENDTGTKPIPAALVAAGNQILVIDLTNASAPSLAATLTLDQQAGKIFSFSAVDDEWVAATNDGIFFIDSTAVLREGATQAASVIETIAVENSARSVGVNEASVTTVYGGKATTAVRQPKIRVVQLPNVPVQSAAQFVGLNDAEKQALLNGAVELPVLLPAPLKEFECDDGNYISVLSDPPNPAHHHYALITASGSFGESFKIAVESLGPGGELHQAMGKEYPPVMLTEFPASLNLDESQPEMQALTARRLSDDPSSVYYNRYITDSFIVLRSPVTDAEYEAITDLANRQAIWSGDYVRFSVDAAQAVNPELASFSSKIISNSYLPRATRTYIGIPGEYIDNPNPSYDRAAPRYAGIDLQSGEYRQAEVDLQIEGRAQDLIMARAYESRGLYVGPFGRGWDFNWNARIHPLPDTYVPPDFSIAFRELGDGSCAIQKPGDVLLIDGMGKVLYFRKISEANGNLDALPAYSDDPAIAEFFGLNADIETWTFYESPEDEFSILIKVADGRWVAIAPNAARTWFHADGRLDRIIHPFDASVMQVSYREDGLIDRVIGDRGFGIEFGYYKKFFYDTFLPSDVTSDGGPEYGRIARIRSTDPFKLDAEIEYFYDDNGNLAQIKPKDRAATVVSYDDARPNLLHSIGNGDSTQGFTQQVMYDADGMVTSTLMMGEEVAVAGAELTLRERAAAGDAEVSITQPTGNIRTIPVDNRGRPTEFANRPFTADDAGRVTKVADAETELNIVYDVNNPVYRFRGNIIRNEEIIDGEVAFESTSSYDGTAFNRLNGLTDVNGVETTITTTSDMSVKNLGGLVSLASTLNDFAQITSHVADSDGTVFSTNYLYTGSGPDTGLLSTTTPVGAVADSVSRDNRGRVDAHQSDGEQYTVQFNNLDFDLPTNIFGDQSPSVARQYDEEGRLDLETISSGAMSVAEDYSYDAVHPSKVGKVVHQETGLPVQTTTYSYDAEGRVESMTIGNETTTYLYDGTRATSVAAPGHLVTTEFDGGTLPSVTTDRGVAAEFTWERGRLKSVKSAGAETVLSYDSGKKRPRAKTIGDLNGFGVLLDEQFSYDAAGRLQRIDGTGGRIREYSFFPDGIIKSMRINGAAVRLAARDAAGRVTRTLLGDVQTDYSAFNESDIALSEKTTLLTSGLSFDTNYNVSNGGRFRSETTGGATWEFRYDGFSNLEQSVDPDGVTQSQTFSPSGSILTSTFADGALVTYSYDSQWRVTQISSPAGSINLTHADGVTTRITYPDGSSVERSGINEFFEAETISFGSVVQNLGWTDGRLTSLDTSAGDNLRYTYDGLGQTRNVTLNGFAVDYVFNQFGDSVGETTPLGIWQVSSDARARISTETYPSGFTLNFSPDELGRPTSIAEINVSEIDWVGGSVWRYLKFDNNLCLAREFDQRLRITAVLYGVLENGTECDASQIRASQNPTAGFAYDFTLGNRVLSEFREHDQSFDVFTRSLPAEAMRITDFAFSAQGSNGDGAAVTVSGYQFDARNENLGATAASGADDRALNPQQVLDTNQSAYRLDSIDGDSVAYDDIGSVIEAPLWVFVPGSPRLEKVTATLSYDGLQMLKSVERADGCNISYERDGLGRIHRRIVTGPGTRCINSITRYVWKGQQLIEEYDEIAPGQNILSKRYVYLGSVLVHLEVRNSNGDFDRYIPLVALNGSIGGYLAPDGTLVEQILYGAYGVPVRPGSDNDPTFSRIASTLLFHGAWWDEATGLYQMGQRNLHPVIGRFLQRDNAYFVENLALYSAFDGDPIGKVDSMGTFSTRVPVVGDKSLSDLKSIKGKALALGDSVNGFTDALNAQRNWRPRKNSDVASGAVGVVSSALDLAGTLVDEQTKADIEKTKKAVDDLKGGIDQLQNIATAIKDVKNGRATLAGVRAITWTGSIGAQKGVPAPKLLSRGATYSVWDVSELDQKLINFPDYKKARGVALEGDRNKMLSHYVDTRRNIAKAREKHLLSVGKGLNKLAEIYLDRAFEGTTNKEVKAAVSRSKGILKMSGGVLSMADAVIKARGDKALAPLKKGLGAIGYRSALRKAYGHLGLAYDAGNLIGQGAIIAFSDPESAEAFQKLTKQYEKDGGLLTVVSGAMSYYFGWDEAAFAIQSWHDSGLRSLAPPNFNLIGGKRAAITQQYLQGLDAP